MFSQFMDFQLRRWAYGLVEIACISVFGFTFFRLVTDNPFRFGAATDPGMARATAACFVVLSAGVFIVTNCIKRFDPGK